MTLLAETKDRVASQVPALTGALYEAAEFAALVKTGALPQKMFAGYILPAGLDAGKPDAIAGLYRQSYEDSLSIVLVLQAPGDATGKQVLPKLDVAIADVLAALCGWVPPAAETAAQFQFRRGRMVPSERGSGAVFYQLDFSLQRQLRITRS